MVAQTNLREVDYSCMTRIRTSGRPRSDLLPVLKTVKQWICWDHDRYDTNDKIPINPGKHIDWRNEFESADYQDKSIYTSYEESLRCARKHNSVAGIGFVFKGVKVSYIDVDDCVNPQTMEINKETHAIIDDVSSYTELSTSGTGIHILCRGNSPSYGWSTNKGSVDVSVFDESWLAITQRHIQGTPSEIEGSKRKLSNLCTQYNIGTHGGW